MGTGSKSSTTNNKSTSLSTELIVNTAYELARSTTGSAISMRQIAKQLSVTPMAIYKYFADKEALTAAIIDTHMKRSNLIPEDIPETDWRPWIKEAFLRMWDAYADAPNMLTYTSSAISPGPAALQWHNQALKVLIKAGLSPQQALTGHAAMAELATGSALLTPLRQQGVEKAFPGIWETLQKNKDSGRSMIEFDPEEENEYHWLILCGQAMLEDMQDTRTAFVKELELLLNSVAAQIDANLNAAE